MIATVLTLAALAAPRAEGPYDQVKLDAFVAAKLAVRDLAAVWNPRIQAAETREQAGEMIGQASAEMVAAVDRTEGISADEYQAIRAAAESDPALAAQIDEIYRQRAGD
jgi:hypothetical protein